MRLLRQFGISCTQGNSSQRKLYANVGHLKIVLQVYTACLADFADVHVCTGWAVNCCRNPPATVAARIWLSSARVQSDRPRTHETPPPGANKKRGSPKGAQYCFYTPEYNRYQQYENEESALSSTNIELQLYPCKKGDRKRTLFVLVRGTIVCQRCSQINSHHRFSISFARRCLLDVSSVPFDLPLSVLSVLVLSGAREKKENNYFWIKTFGSRV